MCHIEKEGGVLVCFWGTEPPLDTGVPELGDFVRGARNAVFSPDSDALLLVFGEGVFGGGVPVEDG